MYGVVLLPEMLHSEKPVAVTLVYAGMSYTPIKLEVRHDLRARLTVNEGPLRSCPAFFQFRPDACTLQVCVQERHRPGNEFDCETRRHCWALTRYAAC